MIRPIPYLVVGKIAMTFHCISHRRLLCITAVLLIPFFAHLHLHISYMVRIFRMSKCYITDDNVYENRLFYRHRHGPEQATGQPITHWPISTICLLAVVYRVRRWRLCCYECCWWWGRGSWLRSPNSEALQIRLQCGHLGPLTVRWDPWPTVVRDLSPVTVIIAYKHSDSRIQNIHALWNVPKNIIIPC